MKKKVRSCILAILSVLLVLPSVQPYRPATSSTTLRVDMIAVWQHQDVLYVCPGGIPCLFDYWDVWYSLWDDASQTWWTPTGGQAAPIAKLDGDDVDPAVAFDTQGNAIAVWAHNGTRDFEVYYSRWGGTSWSAPAPVDVLPGDDTDPVIASDQNGYALALWVHDYSSIYYALWNGASWVGQPVGQQIVKSWPNNFNVSALPEVAFTSATAASGGYTLHKAIAVWAQTYQDSAYRSRIFYNLWDGTGWSPSPPQAVPGQVANVTADGVTSTDRNGLSSNGLGNAVAVWGSASVENPLYYSIWIETSGSWTAASPYTSNGRMPGVAYRSSGDAISVYVRSTPPNIWESKFSANIWSPGAQVADSNGADWRPSIASHGTRAMALWWMDHPSNSEIFFTLWDSQSDSWSLAQPIGLQGRDRNPAVASSTGSPTMPPSTHDLAVVKVWVSSPLSTGGLEYIWATVTNQGDFAEIFNATAYANQSVVGSLTGIGLEPRSSAVIRFDWNTAVVPRGVYVISVTASAVPGEADTANNLFRDGIVMVINAGAGGGGGINIPR